MVGGDYIDRNYEAAAIEGRICQIAFLGSAKANVNFRPMLAKRLTHTASGLRPRSVADKGKMAQALEEKVWPHLNAGRCKPVIDSTFPATEASKGPRANGKQRAHRQDRPDVLIRRERCACESDRRALTKPLDR